MDLEYCRILSSVIKMTKTKKEKIEDIKSRLGAVPYIPDPRDYRVAQVTPEVIRSIPPENRVLLRYIGEWVDNQGNIGSCVGWCGSRVREIVDNIHRSNDLEPEPNPEPLEVGTELHDEDLSAGWAYQKSRDYTNIPLPSEGSTNAGLVKAMLKEGICREEFCKTDTRSPFTFDPEPGASEDAEEFKISAYYRVSTDPVSMQAAMMGLTMDPGYMMPDGSKGMCPLITAYPVYETFSEGYDDGIVPMPESGDKLLGGHSSAIVGWKLIDGEPYWINCNSWGNIGGKEYIGDEEREMPGFFYIPFGYEFYDAWIVRVGEKPDPEPEPEPDPEDLVTIELLDGLGKFVAAIWSMLGNIVGWKGKMWYGREIKE